ncbi:unnamed protein product [Effrenium voratum]|nr:unnamed protein product [Effrenium voratum]
MEGRDSATFFTWLQVLPPEQKEGLDGKQLEQGKAEANGIVAPARRVSTGQRPNDKAAQAAVRRTSSVSSDRPRRSGIARSSGGSAASLGSLRQEDAPSARRRPTNTVTRVASAGRTAAGDRAPRRADAPRETSRERELDRERQADSQLRRLEVQLAGFKTRNAALEGEVAGLRAEAQAVQRDQEEEITRLRQELQSKDAQLQQQEKEFKKLQDQNKTLQGFMRVPGGSMSLPAPTTLPQPSPRMTPRNTPQIFSPALCSQPRVLRSTEPVLSLQTAGPPMSLATFPVRLGQPCGAMLRATRGDAS